MFSSAGYEQLLFFPFSVSQFDISFEVGANHVA